MPGRMLFRYTSEEVAKHNTTSDLWVIYNKKVYDITDFAMDHPGGLEIIKEWGGKDVTKILVDPVSHKHSDAAYQVLGELCVGELVEGPLTNNDSNPMNKISTFQSEYIRYFDEKANQFHSATTDIDHDFQKEKFLDLSKPLFDQMVNCKFSKEFYLRQIHQPRHLPYSANLFENPWLELLTRTPWYVVPIVWLPVVSYHIFMGLELGLSPTILLFFAGIGMWSLFEYGIHRFLFHVDSILPDHPYALTLHFTLHGIHHYMPMDKLRLVMPPVLAGVLAVPIILSIYAVFPVNIAHGIIAGTVFGYVSYDLTHYYLHHARPFGKHFKDMKSYHLAHHYKDYELGYGITSKIWDKFFGTLLE